jgi:hypothetical protein
MNFKGIGFESHQKVIPTLLRCLFFFKFKAEPQNHQSSEDTFENSKLIPPTTKNQDENFQPKSNKLIKKYNRNFRLKRSFLTP